MIAVLRTRCGAERAVELEVPTLEYMVPLLPRRGVVDPAALWPSIRMGMTPEEMADARREHEERVFGKPERRVFVRERVLPDGTWIYVEDRTE